jgi:hypothetical protein
MGRKKSASVLKPFSAMYPAQSCNALDRIGEANVCPRKNLVMGKMQFMNYKQDQWFALIYWVAYEILPVVDIHRPPYTKKKSKTPGSLALSFSTSYNFAKPALNTTRDLQDEMAVILGITGLSVF